MLPQNKRFEHFTVGTYLKKGSRFVLLRNEEYCEKVQHHWRTQF